MNPWARKQAAEQLALARLDAMDALEDGLPRDIALDFFIAELARAETPLAESDRDAALSAAESILLPARTVAEHA